MGKGKGEVTGQGTRAACARKRSKWDHSSPRFITSGGEQDRRVCREAKGGGAETRTWRVMRTPASAAEELRQARRAGPGSGGRGDASRAPPAASASTWERGGGGRRSMTMERGRGGGDSRSIDRESATHEGRRRAKKPARAEPRKRKGAGGGSHEWAGRTDGKKDAWLTMIWTGPPLPSAAAQPRSPLEAAPAPLTGSAGADAALSNRSNRPLTARRSENTCRDGRRKAARKRASAERDVGRPKASGRDGTSLA